MAQGTGQQADGKEFAYSDDLIEASDRDLTQHGVALTIALQVLKAALGVGFVVAALRPIAEHDRSRLAVLPPQRRDDLPGSGRVTLGRQSRGSNDVAGHPGHGRSHYHDLLAALPVVANYARNVGDALDAANGCATEFHHYHGRLLLC